MRVSLPHWDDVKHLNKGDLLEKVFGHLCGILRPDPTTVDFVKEATGMDIHDQVVSVSLLSDPFRNNQRVSATLPLTHEAAEAILKTARNKALVLSNWSRFGLIYEDMAP